VNTLATHFASAPTLGLAKSKQLIYASGLNTLDQQLQLEADTMRELGYSNDYREGVSAFLEKRSPAFKGK
jgi:2-(1,2-epoxy-1,2-dihydrophenyl)acetyl-CoA isomerase